MLAAVLIVPAYLALVVAYGASPSTTDVGYAPVQPIPYSHLQHAGQLGIDCRYCHTTVEVAAVAAIPPTATCINCHSQQYGIRADSPKLRPLHEAFYGGDRPERAGLPIPWVRVHDLPDYVYFNHAAHVNRGVGCVSCHGRVDRMEVLYQQYSLSMSWCLACHRDPAQHLRPLDAITDMMWMPPAGQDPQAYGERLMEQYGIRGVEYMQMCSICHR